MMRKSRYEASKFASHDLWGKIEVRPENKNSLNVTIVTNALHRN